MEELKTPKQSKGGVFAQTDVVLIKDALLFFLKENKDITSDQERQAANLLHRLNNRI